MATCFLCPARGSACLECGQVEHCPAHAPLHRPAGGPCLPFTVRRAADGRGRHMVATRDIRPTELVLAEEPVVVGPYTRGSQRPQCLQCFRLLPSPGFRCPTCDSPMCGPECAAGPGHAAECAVLAGGAGGRGGGARGGGGRGRRGGQREEQHAAIMAIRLLHLREADPDTWERFCQLEHHCEERREAEAELWSYHQRNVADFLTKRCGMDVTSTDVHELLGRMFTNCGDLQQSEGYGRGCGFYPTYANMNHSCIANTKTVKFSSSQRLEVRAQTTIRQGEELSTQYLLGRQATYARRPALRAKWYFECGCPRCCDPAECGSQLAALSCPAPRCGGPLLPSDPLDGEADWRCGECGAARGAAWVMQALGRAAAVLADTVKGEDSVQHWERVLCQLTGTLRPSHYLMVDVKEKLAILYGNIPSYRLPELTRPMKERKIQLCQDLLDVISIVEPGYTRTRGQMLAEMNRTKAVVVEEDLRAAEGPTGKALAARRLQQVCTERQFLQMYLAFYQSLFHGNQKNI